MIRLPIDLQKIYPFASRWFTTKDGHQMHFLDQGSGSPILMVHGNPTWSFFYRNLVLGFENQYRCIVPDHIGCGLSQKPNETHYNYALKNRIDDLAHLVEHLDLKKFHLIVHDWGGAIGLGMAQRFPDRLQKVVLLNTAAFASTHIPLRINCLKMPFIGSLLVRGANAFANCATFMAVKKPLKPLVKRGYLFPYNNWRNRIAILKFVQDIPMSHNHPSWLTLKKIENGLSFLNTKKVLICWGGLDFCFNTHFEQQWKQLLPDANTIFYPNAGHYMLEDAMPEILGPFRDFFIN